MPTLLTPFDSLTHFITAAGALGTAAFGLVEAAKGTTPLGVAGLRRLERALGRANLRALHRTYGKEGWDHILRGAYRKGDAALMQVLRDGLKVALDGPEDKEFAKALNLDSGKLEAALKTFRDSQVKGGPGVDEAQLQEGRKVLGTAELTLNAWVEGAVATAMNARVGWTQCWAGIVAILGALSVAAMVPPDGSLAGHLGKALLLGVVAVPIAPISKDLVSLLKAAKEAVGRR
ncbi:hypothetical protein [Geothrix terrae]|uniref:hypothetical protein n=1 Tax=Geothrix terrae TaxID=2922720 RepID=UPI001FABCE97|nr:hypothetical protein [Geothrix terrae]